MADFVAAEQILVWFLSFRALSRVASPRCVSLAPAARRGRPCLPSADSPARVCVSCVSRIVYTCVRGQRYILQKHPALDSIITVFAFSLSPPRSHGTPVPSRLGTSLSRQQSHTQHIIEMINSAIAINRSQHPHIDRLHTLRRSGATPSHAAMRTAHVSAPPRHSIQYQHAPQAHRGRGRAQFSVGSWVFTRKT